MVVIGELPESEARAAVIEPATSWPGLTEPLARLRLPTDGRPAACLIRNAAGAALQVLSGRFVGTERRIVELTTGPQSSVPYTIA